MEDVIAAKILIKTLDLTSLNSDDTEAKIKKLCLKAQTPYGNTAAVCIYSKFIPLAKEFLDSTNIKIATVVNFPKGEADFNKLIKEINNAVKLGANEIDAVFPYKHFLENDIFTCQEFLKIAREECGDKTLKIILETGEIKKSSLIVNACKLCFEAKADFIKTSTGKSKISATPEAANLILEAIADTRHKIGFKASGGIKTIDDAKKYLILAQSIMGTKWINPKNFRIGASSLLDDLIKVIERGY